MISQTLDMSQLVEEMGDPAQGLAIQKRNRRSTWPMTFLLWKGIHRRSGSWR